MTIAVVLMFGLVIGSFLNVCIVRLPLGASIVSPPSHCPRCSEPIRYSDNIPLLSYVLLRGRCRHCGLPISLRYPLVEVMNALFYLWTVLAFGLTGEALLLMAFCSALIVITFIDLDHQIIPDVITVPGILIGVLIAPFFLSPLDGPLPFGLTRFVPLAWPHLVNVLNAVIGMLCGAFPLFAIGWLWEKLRNIEAMGGGDIKLMGMVGSFLGWKGALLTIMLGAIAGSIIGVALIAIKRRESDQVIPFGPFLAFGSVVTAFYGQDIMDWYSSLLGR